MGDYLGGPNIITRKDRNKVKEANVRERFEDATLLALKIEEGDMSQGKRAAYRSWKRQGNGFSSRTSRRNAVLPTC